MKTFSSQHGPIFYTIQGEGPRNFLLVHNSGGSHEMMNYSATYLAKNGRVLNPDLLGHGRSSTPKIEYTPEVYAETLIQLCRHEKMEHIVFLGLNYGCAIGIVLAQMAPSLFSHLILIEPAIFLDPWIKSVVEEQIQQLAHPNPSWAKNLVDEVLLKSSPDEYQIALKSLEETPSFVKASTFKNLLIWDEQHAFQCSIPTLMIQATNPFTTEQQVRTLFPKLQVGRVVGSGPWVTLEAPEQLHAMIDRYLGMDF